MCLIYNQLVLNLFLLLFCLDPGNSQRQPVFLNPKSHIDNPFDVTEDGTTKKQSDCFVGSEISDENLNNRNGAFLLLCPSLIADCDGTVREWHFHSGADDNTPAFLGFWREASNNSVQLVGFNRVKGSQLGRHTIHVADDDSISILRNDFIGVFYEHIWSEYSVVAYQRYARTFTAANNVKLQQCLTVNMTYQDIMAHHGRVTYDRLSADPTLISLQAVVDRHPLFSCYAGPDPKSFTTTRSGTWLALMPAASFPCSGRIIRWELLSVAAALQPISVYLAIWRFATNTTWTSPSTHRQILQRVAYQQVLVDRNGFMILEGSDLYEIYVQKNDFLGIYFDAPSADSGVPIVADMMTLPTFTDSPDEILPTQSSKVEAAREINYPEFNFDTVNEEATTLGDFLKAKSERPAADGASMMASKGETEMEWCILSKVYREKIDNAMDIGTLTLSDFYVRRCAAAIRAFVKDFTLTDCGMPPNVFNSIQHGDASFETSLVTYECTEGYVLVGDPSVVCQSNGLWTTPPDCVESFEKSGLSPCHFPPPVEHAQAKIHKVRNNFISENSTDFFEPLSESTYASYRCKTGFLMVGKPDVECKPPGVWGDLPKCAEIVHACRAGKVVEEGGIADEPLLMAFTKMRFTCSGEIHTWEYYSNSSDGEVIHFDVWRKIDNGHYRLVGSNPFPALRRGRVIQPVEVSDRIRVAAGDFIGIHYVSTKVTPVIPVFTTRTAGELARLLGDTYILNMHDAALVAFTTANHGYLDLRKLAIQKLRLPPIIAYANALPGCGLPSEVVHAKYVAKSTVQGSVASYECNKGYDLYGRKDVFCRSPNMWTNPPVCLPIELCRTGPRLYNASLANAASFLNIFKQMNFPCAGVVSEWEYYSRTEKGVVYFGVWRHAPGDRVFELVGVNRVEVNGTGLHRYYVSGHERITVLQDYYVGIHYDDPLMLQDDVVVPHADETRPQPYSYYELYDGWTFNVGHDAIVQASGKLVLSDKDGGLRKRWRIPAVNPVVRRALVSCGSPPTVPNSALMGRETTQHSVRTYVCDRGYFLVGHENITCHVSGRWSEPPLCVHGCKWGKAIPRKEFNTRSQRNVLSIFVSKPLTERGFVKSWQYFSVIEYPTSFYADIWRRNGTQQLYLLIGTNKIRSTGYGLQTAEIAVEEQIFAEAGDVVGFHYDIMTPPVIAEAEPEDYAYHPNDMYDVLEEMDYGVIHPGTTFVLAPVKIRKAAKLPSLAVTVLNYQSQPYGLCEPDTTCPKNSECIQRDRHHFVCMCSSGFWLRFDGKACLPAAGIGEPCDESVSCASQVMTCSEHGVCECIAGWTPSSDGHRCKPVSPNPEFRYSVHGEPCDSGSLCYHAFRDQECRDGICQCRRGYRWASDFERRANPETLEECRAINVSQGLLPELAELCYIDQRAYYDRIRRSQKSQQYAMETTKVKTLTGAEAVFESTGLSQFSTQNSNRSDVIRAAIISAISMLFACAVMFAVWSWNSRQGIYPLEKDIGNRIGNIMSTVSKGNLSSQAQNAFSSVRQNVNRQVFQRFHDGTEEDSVSIIGGPMAAVEHHNRLATAAGPLANVSMSQCSLNLNEIDECPAALAVSNPVGTSPGPSEDIAVFNGDHSTSFTSVPSSMTKPSDNSQPTMPENSSLNNQYGERSTLRFSQSDTLMLLSASPSVPAAATQAATAKDQGPVAF